jgi:ABC-type transporter Mla MlaB component
LITKSDYNFAIRSKLRVSSAGPSAKKIGTCFLFTFKVIVGIFSLFGKKNDTLRKSSSDKTTAKKIKSKSVKAVTSTTQDDEQVLSQSALAQRHIARATERKIDAIEFEMSRDMSRSRSLPRQPELPAATSHVTETSRFEEFISESSFADFPSTLPVPDYLFSESTDIAEPSLTQSESVPLLEEAAILFASGQKNAAEQMLLTTIVQDELGTALQSAWYMLFDIYQIDHNQDAFDQLSIEYANKFETSPPTWDSAAVHARVLADTAHDDSTPSLIFPSFLDGNIIKILEKLQQLSKQTQSLRLDFARVKKVDPVGCGLLLRILKNLKKSKHELILVGAQNLTEKIHLILEVGRRDETEAPWLLLLELLQFLHFEKLFEEVSIDYCVTFEVSPPSFEIPQNQVGATWPAFTLEEEPSNRFMMPVVIEGRTDGLINQIAEYAKLHRIVLLDCSHLERVEFGASAQLLSGLVPLAGKKDTTIEFHEVNYLVLSLFNAMGLKNVAAIFPRKR